MSSCKYPFQFYAEITDQLHVPYTELMIHIHLATMNMFKSKNIYKFQNY